MKKNLLSFVILGLTTVSSAFAAPIEMSRVLRDQTTTVALDLNEKSVFCTDRGYGNVQLKISVPDLVWLASLDHRVAGEKIPCITGGRCTNALDPKDILSSERIAVTRLRVILTEHIRLDAAARTCVSTLEESVAGIIRGHKFNHLVYDNERRVDYEICAALVSERKVRPAAPRSERF